MNATTLRAAEIAAHEKLIAHEAAHAAAALAQGLHVSSVYAPPVSLAERPEDPLEPAGVALIERPSDPAGERKLAIAVIAGRLEEGAASWPPPWPLTAAPEWPDEQQLCTLVKALELDRAGYAQLVQDAFAVATSTEYERLHAVIGELLERHGHVDAAALRKVKAIVTGAEVQHAIKVATVTSTERGAFTAIAAAYSVDRVKDQILPGAFEKTIARWRASGKQIPLHWNHEGDAHNIIGSVDPHAMRETAEGLRVKGKLDIADSDTAREAWRSMRNNTMSLSFGYVTTKSRKRNDGINELIELDLFEISVVPIPANPDTRVLAMKSLDDGTDLATVRQQARDEIIAYMGGNSADTLRAKAKRVEREFAPIQLASFKC